MLICLVATYKLADMKWKIEAQARLQPELSGTVEKNNKKKIKKKPHADPVAQSWERATTLADWTGLGFRYKAFTVTTGIR